MRAVWLTASGIVLLGVLAGCTALPVIDAEVCGNAVYEPESGEDCDTFADQKETPGAVCRAKGRDGECHFDCQANSDGQRPPCPDGMGCANDGICRRPTDEFAPKVPLSSDQTSWLSTLDFDGDGRLELLSTEPADQLQQARFRLHYFDAQGQLSETRTFPRVGTRPIARQLDSNPGQDLIFSNLRIGMVPGRADRDWVPATFSSYVVDSALRVVGLRDDEVGGATPLAALSVIDGVSGVRVPSIVDNGKLALRARFSRPIADLAGTPIAADIVPGPDSPCRELVFAFLGETSFRVLDMCRRGDVPALDVMWRETPREQVVELPTGVSIDAGPLAADIDGDGNVDIAIGANGGTYVAHGNGTGLEGVARGPLGVPVYGQDEPFQLPMPLAAGDVTGDGVADFVLPGGVLASQTALTDSKLRYFTSYTNNAQRWTMAELADLNGNGLPDIIAASAGAPGLTFLNGTGGPYQVAARLSSRGPLRFLTTGDFDGDLIGDVAFVEDGPPREASELLSVAFGARDGTPLPATRVAELAGVEQLGGYHQLGIDNLFTATRSAGTGQPYATLTLFDGNPDRLPFAPYTLVSFSHDRQLQDYGALAVIAGGFSAKGGNDVVALGTQNASTDWTLWLIPSFGDQRQTPQLLSGTTPEGALPVTRQADGSIMLSVAGAAADLEGDGFDEALWLMPQGPDACVLLRYDIDGGAGAATVKSQLSFDEPCVTPQLSAADLNGDGHQDLLLLLGDPSRGPRRLEVLWNDGQGGFSLEERSFISDTQQSDVRAFSVFPVPRAGRHEPPPSHRLRVAFVTASALHIASAPERERSYDVVRDIPGFQDARAVSVTDPNADNVSDVAVADAEGVWLVEAKLQ